MGKLNFSQKIVAANNLKSATYYKVKKNSNGYTLSDVFNVQNFFSGADTIEIYINGNINSTPIVALAVDPEWVNPATEQNVDNTPLPVGAVIQMNSNLNKLYSAIELVNYNQGKTSIKKQNLTSLKPYSIDGGTTEYDANAVYIFKGGSTNTVSTVFNYLELTRGSTSSNSDMIFLSSINALIYYKGSGIAQGWKNASTGGDATNLVINDNEIIYFTPISNKQISVSSGAIIQRYSNGKASLKKSNLSKLISTGSFTFVRGSNNTIATFSNGSEFVNNNNSSLADKISISSSQSGGFISYYLRGDGITWRRPASTDAQNNTIIPDGSIILYDTYNSVLKEFTVQGNNIVRVN
jgi:hypothetical protein